MQLEEWCTELKTHQSELRVAGAAAAGLKGSCITEELAVGADALGSLMLLGHDKEVCVNRDDNCTKPSAYEIHC